MRIALAGQRSFGAAALERVLAAGHDVAQVFAPPGDRLDFLARRHGLEVRDRLVADALADKLDLIVCAHAHVFVSEKARDRTLLGGIGYHPSLLPRHRGRDAVKWTVHMGDAIAGGSVYWLSNRMDGGPIAAADWCHVAPGTSASDLWRDQLFPMGLRLLESVLADLDRGLIIRVDQDEACATWEPSWDRPPVERPDLVQLAGPDGDPLNGRFRVVRERNAA
jgi:methionyl-tRNA formyltransferase